MIELHAHSTCSDGMLSPEQLVAEARQMGVTTLALTDHDTTAGVARMQAAATAAGMRGIAGVEVSCEPPPDGTLHMLGYFVDPADAFLEEHLRWIREGRQARNEAIIQRLNQLGVRITMAEVRAYAADYIVARPHFAQCLIDKGYARHKRDAFERYLAKGKSAYVERRRLTAAAGIELIRRAGGVPVLAHPFTLKLEREPLQVFVRGLVDSGLGGIECWYPEHSTALRRQYLKLAREFRIVPSGGSDFHGLAAHHEKQIHTIGCMPVPAETVSLLEAEARRPGQGRSV